MHGRASWVTAKAQESNKMYALPYNNECEAGGQNQSKATEKEIESEE